MLVLVAVVIVALLAMTMFTVDVAYMQLVRTELRAATDASAKAGMEALRRTQDTEAAIDAAIATAAANKVGGRSLTLTADQIEFGLAFRNVDNSVSFNAGQLPYTAVRVNSAMTESSAAGPVPLFLAVSSGRASSSRLDQPSQRVLKLKSALRSTGHTQCVST